MKQYVIIIILSFLVACQNNNAKIGSVFSSNPCDVYIGKWKGSINYTSSKSLPVTFTITSNGQNYLFEKEENSNDSKVNYSIPVVCENGLLLHNGIVFLTYVNDGGYILIENNKFYKESTSALNSIRLKKEEKNITNEKEYLNIDCAPSNNKVIINGNNVRIRSEPNTRKENVITQLNKGIETIYIGEVDIEGEKWYNVCYKKQIGWVSAKFAFYSRQNYFDQDDKYTGTWSGNEAWMTIVKLSDGSYNILFEDVENNSNSCIGRLEKGYLKYSDPKDKNMHGFLVFSSTNCLKDGYFEYCKK